MGEQDEPKVVLVIGTRVGSRLFLYEKYFQH